MCAVGAQSVYSREPGLSVASLLDGQAGQVFCQGVVSVKGQIACQFTLVFGGLFPMCQILFLLFAYNLVLPDVFVCWTDSQDKLAKGTLFWVLLSVGKSLVVECVAVAFLKVVITF